MKAQRVNAFSSADYPNALAKSKPVTRIRSMKPLNMMVSKKVHLRRCVSTSSLQRTCKCASLLSFYAPCSWSFLRNHRLGDFLRDHQIKMARIQPEKKAKGTGTKPNLPG
jgi:hypothetical protein